MKTRTLTELIAYNKSASQSWNR